jgi:glycosyltransferase involved in cell wall biosynthesis
MVANLIARKGVREFLGCLEKEVRSEDDFIINIAGRYDIERCYAEACFEYTSRSSLLRRSIKFLGPVPVKRMKALYASSSVLISASKMETYGMAIKEAQAFGLPALAYDGGFVRTHIRPGENGYLCSSLQELAGICVKFIRDPEGLKSLRDKTKKFHPEKNYTWDKAARMFIEQTFNLPRGS